MQLLLLLGAWERIGNSAWFLTVALGCCALLLLSMLFGHDHDHDADHDTDHDHDHDAHGRGNMSVFSIKIILAFGVGFGAGGYIGSRYDLSFFLSCVCGLGGGLVMGAITYLFLNTLYKSQSSSTVQNNKLVGTNGVVETTIDAKSVGRISCALPSGKTTFLARSASGKTLKLGTPVKIISADGSILSVDVS